ncbi:MAG: hypothetical protein R3B95_08290, partial [Nitrospirales bacterium]|nr:hypothetical protein [Nitrospirales bacterium]
MNSRVAPAPASSISTSYPCRLDGRQSHSRLPLLSLRSAQSRRKSSWRTGRPTDRPRRRPAYDYRLPVLVPASVSMIIPNPLFYRGSMLVIDPKESWPASPQGGVAMGLKQKKSMSWIPSSGRGLGEALEKVSF